MACTNQTVRSTARAPPTPTARSTPSPGTSATARPAAASARPTSSSAPAPTRSLLTITGDARGACGALDTAETTVTVVEAPRIEIVGPDRVAAGAAGRLRRGAGRRRATCAARASTGTSATARPPPGRPCAHAFAEPGVRTVTLRAVAARRQRRLRHHRDPAARHGQRAARAGHRRARPRRRRRARALRRRRLERPRRGDHRLRLGLRRRRHRERRAGAAPLRRRPAATEVRLAATDDAGVGNSRVVADARRRGDARRPWPT